MDEEEDIAALSGPITESTTPHSTRSIVSGLRDLLNTILETQTGESFASEDLERGVSVSVNINVALGDSHRIAPN